MKLLCILRYVLKKLWNEKRLETALFLFESYLVMIGIVSIWIESIYPGRGVIIIAFSLFFPLGLLVVFAAVRAVRYLFMLAKEAIAHCQNRQGEQ